MLESVIGEFILLIILLLVNGFLSASEAALFSLSVIKLKKLEKSNPDKIKTILDWLAKPQQLLITLLFANIFAMVGSVALAINIASRYYGSNGAAIAILVIALVLILFCQVLPKSYGMNHRINFSLYAIRPLRYLFRLIFPVKWVIGKVTDIIFEIRRPKENKEPMTEDELRTLVDMSQKQGVLDESEKELIKNVLEFNDLEVKDVMTPRVDMKFVNVKDSHANILKQIKKMQHSKIPVVEGNLDKVIGMLDSRAVLLNPRTNFKKFIIPVTFIPENKRVSLLLEEFKKSKCKIAIVVDEFSGTSGIITIEDILEEIFGEIHGEFENVEELICWDENAQLWHVDGRCPLYQFNKITGSNLPEDDDDTISGFVISQMGRIPRSRESLSYYDLRFRIVKASSKRILRLKISSLNGKGVSGISDPRGENK